MINCNLYLYFLGLWSYPILALSRPPLSSHPHTLWSPFCSFYFSLYGLADDVTNVCLAHTNHTSILAQGSLNSSLHRNSGPLDDTDSHNTLVSIMNYRNMTGTLLKLLSNASKLPHFEVNIQLKMRSCLSECKHN